MVYLIVVLILVLIFCSLLFGFAGFTFNGLPVLMYHKVIDEGAGDFLSITVAQLDRQFEYLTRKNYTPIFLSDVLEHISQNRPLPSKPVLITFDDGYKNNFSNLYPLLEKHQLKANIFLVAGFLGSSDIEKTMNSEFLHVDDIAKMSGSIVQFGLHSYDHKSYNDLTISEIEDDIRSCNKRLTELNIPFQPCLAYTYGAYPKKDPKKMNQMVRTMEANGVKCAFRIGNRLNKIPLSNKFQLQRIDVRGDESFFKFKMILTAGKKIFFK